MAKFEVYTSNTLGEIDEQFSSVGRLKKKKIQLKVFQENNSFGGFAQTNNAITLKCYPAAPPIWSIRLEGGKGWWI